MRFITFVAAGALACLPAARASAEHLVTSLSSARVPMTSEGPELELFGSIEPGGRNKMCRGSCSAVIIVREPRGSRVIGTGSVYFLTPTIFRAAIALPPGAPLGRYRVEARLLSAGTMVMRNRTAFELVKSEQ